MKLVLTFGRWILLRNKICFSECCINQFGFMAWVLGDGVSGTTHCSSFIQAFFASVFLMSDWSFGDSVQVTDHPPRSIHTPTMRTAYIGSGLSAPKVPCQTSTILCSKGECVTPGPQLQENWLSHLSYQNSLEGMLILSLKFKTLHSYIMECDKLH